MDGVTRGRDGGVLVLGLEGFAREAEITRFERESLNVSSSSSFVSFC